MDGVTKYVKLVSPNNMSSGYGYGAGAGYG